MRQNQDTACSQLAQYLLLDRLHCEADQLDIAWLDGEHWKLQTNNDYPLMSAMHSVMMQRYLFHLIHLHYIIYIFSYFTPGMV